MVVVPTTTDYYLLLPTFPIPWPCRTILAQPNPQPLSLATEMEVVEVPPFLCSLCRSTCERTNCTIQNVKSTVHGGPLEHTLAGLLVYRTTRLERYRDNVLGIVLGRRRPQYWLVTCADCVAEEET